MAQTPNPRKRHDPMINNMQLPSSCQAQNAFNFFNPYLTKYCQDLLETENYPWGKKANPIQYYILLGNTKLSKDQKLIIKFLHRDYFSRGKACWLKRKNLIKYAKLNPKMKPYNFTRIINRLVERGILFKLSAETFGLKRVYLLPNIQTKEQTQKSFDEFEKENEDTCLSYEKYDNFLRNEKRNGD